MSVLADNTKQTVLVRDAYTCQLNKPGCDRYATVVVPKPGIVRGLRALRSTELRAACRDCATSGV
jgi:hypothetical protein